MTTVLPNRCACCATMQQGALPSRHHRLQQPPGRIAGRDPARQAAIYRPLQRQRRTNAHTIQRLAAAGATPPLRDGKGVHVYHQYTVLTDHREAIQKSSLRPAAPRQSTTDSAASPGGVCCRCAGLSCGERGGRSPLPVAADLPGADRGADGSVLAAIREGEGEESGVRVKSKPSPSTRAPEMQMPVFLIYSIFLVSWCLGDEDLRLTPHPPPHSSPENPDRDRRGLR